MKPTALIPRAAMLRKPPHGAACTNCGVCCMATRCAIGVSLFGDEPGACPALEPAGPDAYRCGVANNPARYMPDKAARIGEDTLRKAALLVIYAGEGCDARFNGEPINHEFHRQNAEQERLNGGARRAALALFHNLKGDET